MTDEPRYIITGTANFVATPPEGETSGISHLPTEPQYVPEADYDALMAWAVDAMDELHDLHGQYEDDYIYKKHNEKPYQELWERLVTLRKLTESGEIADDPG